MVLVRFQEFFQVSGWSFVVEIFLRYLGKYCIHFLNSESIDRFSFLSSIQSCCVICWTVRSGKQ